MNSGVRMNFVDLEGYPQTVEEKNVIFYKKDRREVKILLVEDDEMNLEMMTDILKRFGHHVTGAETGLKALEVFNLDPSEFDMVITDQMMPGMTGIDLAGRLTRIREDLPVILLSGHSYSVVSEEMKANGIRACLEKPVVLSDLKKTIDRLL